MWLSAKQGTTHRPTSHLAHWYTVSFLWPREERTAAQLGWESVCYGDSRVSHFLQPYLVYQPIWSWGDFGSFQLPQSNSSPEGAWNVGGLYLALHEDNSIKQMSIANKYTGLPYLVSAAWQAGFRNVMPLRYGRLLQWQQKTDLKLRCDYCIKFQLFDGAQDVFSILTAVCCMLVQHKPYRLPQHYTRHACGPSCSSKHRFCGYLQFLSIRFVWIVWVQYATDSLSGQQSVRFVRQCWYFNPQGIPVAATNKASSVWTVYVGQNAQLLCEDINLDLWRGFSRWRGTFLLHKETLTFKGPAAYRIGENKMPPNFVNLKGSLRDIFRSCSALKISLCWVKKTVL